MFCREKAQINQASSKIDENPRRYVSASRQDPSGVFLARSPVFSEFLFFRNVFTIRPGFSSILASIPLSLATNP